MALDGGSPMFFTDFPDDVQLNILAFLSPAEISAFACTCRRFAALCSPSSPSAVLWLALCERRWGSKTLLPRWSTVPSPRLYKTLDRFEHLIGFWRRIGNDGQGAPPLVFFEWGTSCIIGSCVSPSTSAYSYAVRKIPFLWLGLSPAGETLSYLHPGCRVGSPTDLEVPPSDPDVIPVTISFMGCSHFVVEENCNFCRDMREDDSVDVPGMEAGSPPDRVMHEIYQFFANRTSPAGDMSSRRHRKRKERLGRRWEAEHFVRIANHSPTPARPLQGLWKGICEDMSLGFYLVAYDDVGGITCRRVGNVAESFSGYSYSLTFWTSNTTFLESPFSEEEQEIYNRREHVGSASSAQFSVEKKVISRIMCINSSYDLVLPDLVGSSGDPRNVEGRIWEYEDGTFGFGFLRNNFIVDLKHITQDGYLLDT
ncbi:F-box protein [Apostasia shenzhenica]|uniref:F-box protein n=1 Tax=Apostasia shenzhenica TaxID=1088818 RepID=A0A2I0ARK3_9ASPA|nr:F-box protein [Apostasia shenzhenica]